MNGVEVLLRPLQLAEPVLEEVVRPVEVGAQASGRRRPMAARERLLAGGAEELAVNADEEPRGDARVSLGEGQLRLECLRQDLHETGHHLELLGLERGGLLDDARERREAGAAEPGALGGLEPPQRAEDRFALAPARDRSDQRRLSRRHLVEEEILFRREVVVNSLLRDVRRDGDLGNRDGVETPLREKLHRPVGDFLPRMQLLRLAQAHAAIVTQFLQLQKSFCVCNVVALIERKENSC
jgi:hypothetical protein